MDFKFQLILLNCFTLISFTPPAPPFFTFEGHFIYFVIYLFLLFFLTNCQFSPLLADSVDDGE